MPIPTILLVDDVPLFLDIVKGFLRSSRVRILTAQDGVEALAVVRQERPDLVVMDQSMPRMDGLTCCATIKKDPALRSIPVIMVSSIGETNMGEAFRQAGCDDYLEKPVNGKVFLDKVCRFVPGIERRSVRVPCRVPVTVRADEGELTAVSEDLSLHGMYVASQAQVRKGSTVVLTFSLPGGDSRIEVQGKVDWLNSPEDRHRPAMPPGFGVEFTLITGEGLALLRENELKEYLDQNQPVT